MFQNEKAQWLAKRLCCLERRGRNSSASQGYFYEMILVIMERGNSYLVISISHKNKIMAIKHRHHCRPTPWRRSKASRPQLMTPTSTTWGMTSRTRRGSRTKMSEGEVYFPEHNGWPKGCAFQSEEGAPVRPHFVSLMVSVMEHGQRCPWDVPYMIIKAVACMLKQ